MILLVLTINKNINNSENYSSEMFEKKYVTKCHSQRFNLLYWDGKRVKLSLGLKLRNPRISTLFLHVRFALMMLQITIINATFSSNKNHDNHIDNDTETDNSGDDNSDNYRWWSQWW